MALLFPKCGSVSDSEIQSISLAILSAGYPMGLSIDTIDMPYLMVDGRRQSVPLKA